ncbi:MAG: hypothetical protein RL483_1001 [Pseudomonadota bacterium]|jgi:3-dehydroquinate dehydratase-2
MQKKQIWVLHGPNLNRLGLREPQIYGHTTLDQINQRLTQLGESQGFLVQCHQSNHEGALIDLIHQAPSAPVSGFVINPAAFTHTSVALRDALAAVDLPFIEVHISNVYRREPFRHQSYFSDLAQAVICGFGPRGYELALDHLIAQLQPSS